MENTNTTIENNKLIAQFMGKDVLYETHIHHETTSKTKVTKMQYHLSWDWLMPVVEKIESCFDGSVSVTIDGDDVNIEYSMTYRHNVFGYTKLESTYKAVVEFIEWYNQQNK